MGNRNLTVEKDQARRLFMQGVTSPVALAKIIDVPRQTISTWINRENWDALRTTQAITPLEIAQQITQILNTMLSQVREMKEDGIEVSAMTIKEMIFWTKALRQLDEDYDVRGSLIAWSNQFINFVSAAPADVIPDKKNFVKALNVALPLFLKEKGQ